jgi:hypothetical protein
MEPLLSSPVTVAATLRRFAINRLSGRVELLSPKGGAFTVVLVHGRVAGIEQPGWSLVAAIQTRLVNGGRIGERSNFAATTIDRLFQELQGETSDRDPVDEVFFRRIVREVTLDKILDVELLSASVRGTGELQGDISPSFSPALDTEDLRYDLEGFRADAKRFQSIFPPRAVICASGGALHRLSPVEHGILRVLGSGLDVETLFARALFSRVRFYEALLSLFDRRLIEVRPALQGRTSDEVAEAFGSVIDAAVEVEVVARDLSAAAALNKAETTLLETSLSPRNILALFRRLTGA